MIETRVFEEVTQIRMSREIGGKPAFATLSNGQYTAENLIRSVLKMTVEEIPACPALTNRKAAFLSQGLISREWPRRPGQAPA
jgi:hypothetical protein